MQALIWLILLVLAAVGVASIVDYTGVYDVPMIEVSKQADIAE
ncbi:MAG: hypothetical protein AAFX54_13595 [Pseudomonadota bacterium]